MKQTLSFIWSFLVAIAFSALIHSTDSDVGSIGVAFSSQNIGSVLLISVFLALPMLLCILSFRLRGWKGFLATLLLVASILGLLIAILGTTAQTTGGFIVSVLGMAGISVLVYVLGALPHLILRQRNNISV